MLPCDAKLIPGFPDYCVTNNGVVYSRFVYGSKTRRVGPWWAMKPKTKRGDVRKYVDLFRSVGQPERFQVAQLVLLAFVGPPPSGQEARHLDDDPSHDVLENLAYGTRRDNSSDAIRNKKLPVGEKSHRATLTNVQVLEIRRLRSEGVSYSDLSAAFGKSEHYIRRIVCREIWRHL